MLTIDRYLIRRFLGALGFGLITFTSIYLVVDIIEHLDNFIDKGASISAIIKYYLYYLPFIVVLILPVAMLLASLFSVGLLARHRELVALKSSGMSLYRVLLPLFTLALVISFVSLGIGEIVVPYSNQQRQRIKRVEVEKRPLENQKQRNNVYTRDIYGRIVYAQLYIPQEKVARNVLIQEYNGDVLIRRTDAMEMVWKDGRWILKKVYIRTFVEGEEKMNYREQMERSDLSLFPADLAKQQKDPEEMSFRELRDYIDRVRKIGGEYKRWLVDLHMKISFPFANFIMVLFGAPLASNLKRGGMVVGFVISFLICFLYWGVLQAGVTVGRSGLLPPLLAAWIGNLIFGLAGILILTKVRK